MSNDRDELIAALERVRALCRSEDVRGDIYGLSGHEIIVDDALDEICELAKVQLEKLGAKQ